MIPSPAMTKWKSMWIAWGVALVGCMPTPSVGVTDAHRVPNDSAAQCAAQCAATGLTFAGLVIVEGNVGCVCSASAAPGAAPGAAPATASLTPLVAPAGAAMSALLERERDAHARQDSQIRSTK
jgi:hypothetical protein